MLRDSNFAWSLGVIVCTVESKEEYDAELLYFSWNVIVRHGRNPTRKKTTFLTMIMPFCLFLSTHSSKNREIDTIMSRKVIEFD